VTNERASELGHEMAVRDQPEPRKAYATPRLTRWGAIPRVTAVAADASGIDT
jgi:hypothetical protein